jgi:hypothetical protein
MATPAQFKIMARTVPFRPYTIKMVSGEQFTVRHPENASWSENGPNLVVHMDGEIYQVEMRLVETLREVKAEPSEAHSDEKA